MNITAPLVSMVYWYIRDTDKSHIHHIVRGYFRSINLVTFSILFDINISPQLIVDKPKLKQIHFPMHD